MTTSSADHEHLLLRNAEDLTFKRRPKMDSAPLSRRDSGRWIELRHEFLERCDGGRTLAAITRDMRRRCSRSTSIKIKHQLMMLGLIEEVPIHGQRGNPRLLRRTKDGNIALDQSLYAFRSALHAHAPTVVELTAIRRAERRDDLVSHKTLETESASLSHG
jgi:hypothetical protein